MLALILASALAQDLPEDAGEEVRAAWADVQTFPEDYGALTLLARAAATDNPEVAEAAWARAEVVSGGNVETAVGLAWARLRLDDVVGARRASALAVDRGPGVVDSHLVRVESLRRPVGVQSTEWASRRAHPSARLAVELDPTRADAWCALAWSRVRLGDDVAAARASRRAAQLGGPCEAASEAPEPWSGGAWVGYRGYVGDPSLGGGPLLVAQAGGRMGRAGHAQLTARGSTVTETPSSITQGELWGRLGASRGGHGAQLLAAGLVVHWGGWGAGSITGAAGIAAARAWSTWWATARLDGAVSGYADGTGLQTAAGLRLPVLRSLSLDADVQLTSFVANDAYLSAPPDTGALLSVGARVALDLAPLELHLGGRLGPEVRAIRFDEPSVWNLRVPSRAALSLHAAVALAPRTQLHAALQTQRLQAPAGTREPSLHLAAVGLTTRRGGSP